MEKPGRIQAAAVTGATLLSPAAWGQGGPPGGMPGGASEARQVPLSGRAPQSGTVEASQNTTGTPPGSALTIQGTVNVRGSYLGSVPQGRNTGSILPLRLDYALGLALSQNLGAVSEEQSVRQAAGLRRTARSAWLPQANTVVSETVEQLNLRTLGVEESSFPLAVGPFNFFDARAARVTQAAIDLVRLGNLRTATHNLDAAAWTARDAGLGGGISEEGEEMWCCFCEWDFWEPAV